MSADDPDPSAGSAEDAAESGTVGAIDGAVLLLAAGKASVAPERLPDLVERAAAYLRDRAGTYRRTCERVHADGVREIYFADGDHWTAVGDDLGFDERETDAVRRSHEEQLLHVGRRTGREAEFEHALEIRQPVVVERRGGADADGGTADDEKNGNGNADGTGGAA
ncbi:MAG: hypothetical protein ABEH40_09370 [Haloferacaceae archaeon]